MAMIKSTTAVPRANHRKTRADQKAWAEFKVRALNIFDCAAYETRTESQPDENHLDIQVGTLFTHDVRELLHLTLKYGVGCYFASLEPFKVSICMFAYFEDVQS